jgi:hypothetical protein
MTDQAILPVGQGWFIGRLWVKHFRDGHLIDYRYEGSGIITNAGVNLLVADWNNGTATLKLANFHDSGTGTNAPSITDTVLQIPTGASRGVGTQSNSGNMYQSVGNITYGNTFTITEWGLFTASVGGTLWDHKTFASGYPVHNGDVLQFVYQLQAISGG